MPPPTRNIRTYMFQYIVISIFSSHDIDIRHFERLVATHVFSISVSVRLSFNLNTAIPVVFSYFRIAFHYIPCRDIVDERVIEEVRTGIPYYEKKLPKDAYGDLTGLSPKSMGEDGQFKYRRLPKDSYKQGIITDVRQMGGYPEYKGTPYVDTDKDGMPDEWEIANGLNPNDPSDANKDCTGDGYTNIEKYINGISTKHKVDWRDMKNNYDTLAEKGKLM